MPGPSETRVEALGAEVQHVNRKSGLFGPTMLLTGHEGEVGHLWTWFHSFSHAFDTFGRSLWASERYRR